MKTERRHELQKNMLADKLAHWIDAIEPYSRAILGVIIAALVMMFGWAYLTVRDRDFAEKGWDSFFQAFASQDPEKLGKTAEQYSTTRVSQWARLMDADLLLARGIDQLFSDRTEAKKQISDAADMYRHVSADSESQSPLVARAKFGLARAHEALGELQVARLDYDAIVTEGGPFKEAAKERAANLDRGETKAFYDWFAKYEPPRPGDKPEPKFDFLNESLDRASGMNLPSALGGGSPSKTPPAGEAPITTSPETPAPGTPAPETPATETPAKEPALGTPSGSNSTGEGAPAGSGAGSSSGAASDSSGATGSGASAAPPATAVPAAKE